MYLFFSFFDRLRDEALDFFQTISHFLCTLRELPLRSLDLGEEICLEIIGFSFVTKSSVLANLLLCLENEVSSLIKNQREKIRQSLERNKSEEFMQNFVEMKSFSQENEGK